ncbi:chromosome 9 open reading frame 3 [Plakobranchus ocellatus]|uniref:Chromosome 9 open reading frame 3 n=1 Tax=Plakobranchus ocellatus TaxID=259542 RepID=A0AAV4DV35_9GAST|nr:chromosome 9 open reading frame 3 [Plakobranchus ocellatus]
MDFHAMIEFPPEHTQMISQDEDFQPDQSVLLLDYLIEDNVQLTMSQMKWLRDRLKVLDTGAEVQHSWCELVIQRRDLRWLKDVETFLKQHQAMGVYLYGELMISENRRLQALARSVFNTVRPSMAEAQRLAVEEMLFPT